VVPSKKKRKSLTVDNKHVFFLMVSNKISFDEIKKRKKKNVKDTHTHT